MELPVNWDWRKYLILNPDLTPHEEYLKQHWLTLGHCENRLYDLDIPEWSWEFLKQPYHDQSPIITKNTKCTLVFNLPRSGSSCFIGCVNICGLNIGKNILAANEFNKKGFYENSHLLKFNDTVLSYFKTDIFGRELTEEELQETSKFKNVLSKIIDYEFEESDFVIKDPRLTYLGNLYIETLKEKNIQTKCIIITRNPQSVINSMQHAFNFDLEKSQYEYLKFDKMILNILKTQEYMTVNFERLQKQPEMILKKVCDFLGICFNKKAVNFIDFELINF